MTRDQATDHAALMDDVYRYQRYIYDFTRKYYLFGRDRLIDELALAPGASVVEVGTGTGRNLVRMARRYPGARLYGLDASAEMLKSATRSVARAGLAGRVGLAHGYAEALTPALFGLDRPFDAIVFSYSLSMIPDWKQALKAAAQSLSPAGKVHIVDFGDLTGLGPVVERALRAWLGLFHVAPRIELLHTFEQGVRGQRLGNLRVLAGRYAFLMSGSRDDLDRLVGAVAAESHEASKS